MFVSLQWCKIKDLHSISKNTLLDLVKTVKKSLSQYDGEMYRFWKFKRGTFIGCSIGKGSWRS